jgi:hypothetical protein
MGFVTYPHPNADKLITNLTGTTLSFVFLRSARLEILELEILDQRIYVVEENETKGQRD